MLTLRNHHGTFTADETTVDDVVTAAKAEFTHLHLFGAYISERLGIEFSEGWVALAIVFVDTSGDYPDWSQGFFPYRRQVLAAAARRGTIDADCTAGSTWWRGYGHANGVRAELASWSDDRRAFSGTEGEI